MIKKSISDLVFFRIRGRLCCYFRRQIIRLWQITKSQTQPHHQWFTTVQQQYFILLKTHEESQKSNYGQLNGFLIIDSGMTSAHTLFENYSPAFNLKFKKKAQFFNTLKMNLLCMAFLTNSSLETSPSPSVSTAFLKWRQQYWLCCDMDGIDLILDFFVFSFI